MVFGSFVRCVCVRVSWVLPFRLDDSASDGVLVCVQGGLGCFSWFLLSLGVQGELFLLLLCVLELNLLLCLFGSFAFLGGFDSMREFTLFDYCRRYGSCKISSCGCCRK